MRGLSLSDLEQESERRESYVQQIRDTVLAFYAVGGSTEFCVARTEIHQLIMAEFDWRVISGNKMQELNTIVAGMGAVPIKVGNHRLFASIRKRYLSVQEAKEASKRLRASCNGQAIKQAGKLGNSGNGGWEKVLQAEGLGPVPLLERGPYSQAQKALEQDRKPQINLTGAPEVLKRLTLERRIYLLRNDGVSFGDIAKMTGLRKDQAHRIHNAIMARFKEEDPGPEDE